MINFNTDLTVERKDIYRKANNIEDNIDGIETEEQEVNDKIKITRVIITNEKTFRDFFFLVFFILILQKYYNNITFIQHS